MVGGRSRSSRKPTIPMDVLREVLVRLPAESLLRLRWACKSFLSLTSHPSFLHRNAHLRPPTLIIQPSFFHRVLRRLCPSTIHLHRVDYDHTNVHFVHKVLWPIKAIGRDGDFVPLKVVSSCDGMLCLQQLHAAVSETVPRPYYICNPVTKDWTITPAPPRGGGILAGFYLHRPSREYRLLRHVLAPAGYEVLALGGGRAWRPIDNPFDGSFPLASRMLNLITLPQKSRNLQVHRSLHWVVDVEWVRVSIVAFDVESEKFRQIAPPDIPPWPCTIGETKVKADLIEVDGSLGLCSWSKWTEFVVWKLEDYGRERWCNMYTITVERIPAPEPPDLMLHFVPFLVRRSGKELIVQWPRHGLIVYDDLEKNPPPSSVSIGCVEGDGDTACVVYRESLVWYDSFIGFQGQLA